MTAWRALSLAALLASCGGEAPEAPPADDPCASYCACLEARCAARPGYPLGAGECGPLCARLDDARRTCWAGFCEDAAGEDDALAQHLCEHAWGLYGLEECAAPGG